MTNNDREMTYEKAREIAKNWDCQIEMTKCEISKIPMNQIIPTYLKDKSEGFLEAYDQLSKQLEKERGIIRELVEAMKDLVNGIENASIEVLNGKYVASWQDDEESYKKGAHTFFRLIGDSYPDAKDALSKIPKEILEERSGNENI